MTVNERIAWMLKQDHPKLWFRLKYECVNPPPDPGLPGYNEGDCYEWKKKREKYVAEEMAK